MKANTKLYPFWNPGNSGKAAGFANPTGLAATSLAASLSESRTLQVPQEISQNKNFMPFLQSAASAAIQPAPQMPANIPTIPDPGNLLSLAMATVGTIPKAGK